MCVVHKFVYEFVSLLCFLEYRNCPQKVLRRKISSELPTKFCCFSGEFEGGDVSVAQQMKLIQTVSSGWKKCLEDFQSAHLSRSVSRLFDIVQLAFSSSSSTANKNTERAAATKLPTVEETNAIISKSAAVFSRRFS